MPVLTMSLLQEQTKPARAEVKIPDSATAIRNTDLARGQIAQLAQQVKSLDLIECKGRFADGSLVLVSGFRDSDPRTERIVVMTGRRSARDGKYCLLRDPQARLSDVILNERFLRSMEPAIKTAPRAEPTTAEQMERYRHLLATMDWNYDRADDNRVYREYSDQHAEIIVLQRALDKDYAIYNALVPSFRKKPVPQEAA